MRPAPTRRTFATLLAEFFGLASVMLMLCAVLIVAGCAQPGQDFRVLSAQEQQAVAECRFSASTVGGFNLVNQMINQEVAFQNCLAARGLR